MIGDYILFVVVISQLFWIMLEQYLFGVCDTLKLPAVLSPFLRAFWTEFGWIDSLQRVSVKCCNVFLECRVNIISASGFEVDGACTVRFRCWSKTLYECSECMKYIVYYVILCVSCQALSDNITQSLQLDRYGIRPKFWCMNWWRLQRGLSAVFLWKDPPELWKGPTNGPYHPCDWYIYHYLPTFGSFLW